MAGPGRPKKVVVVSKPPSDPAIASALEVLKASNPVAAQKFEESLAEDAADREIEQQYRNELERQRNEPHVWVEIIRMADDNEPFVFVGAAGVPYKINKGVRVPVPVSVVSALKLARVDGFVPIIDDTTGQKRQARHRYDSYPMSEFGPASAEEVKTWKAEQKRRADNTDRIVDREEEAIIGRPEVHYSQERA